MNTPHFFNTRMFYAINARCSVRDHFAHHVQLRSRRSLLVLAPAVAPFAPATPRTDVAVVTNATAIHVTVVVPVYRDIPALLAHSTACGLYRRAGSHS